MSEEFLITHKADLKSLLKYSPEQLCEIILTCLEIITEKNKQIDEFKNE